MEWQLAQRRMHFLISSCLSLTNSLLLLIAKFLVDGFLWWKCNALGCLSYPHLLHFPPNFSTNSILDFNLLFETRQEPHSVPFGLSLSLNCFLQCLHLHINASGRIRTYDLLITYHFGFRRPCGSWSGLCLHPFWVLSIKSLHLRISALGSALPVKGSPNLKSDSMSIPTQGFLWKSTAATNWATEAYSGIIANQ